MKAFICKMKHHGLHELEGAENGLLGNKNKR